MAKATSIPDIFFQHYGLPNPEREHCFCPERKWRIDFAFPSVRLAVEIEGGIWQRGRHLRGSGFIGDLEKYNRLTEMGWVLLRYPPNAVNFEQIKTVYITLKMRGSL
jgi:very-short-patch-repair endonuclease